MVRCDVTEIADPDFTDPDQFAPRATEGVDSDGNTWTLLGDAELVATDPRVYFPAQIDLTNGGSRMDRFAYTLYDPDLNVIGELNPIVTIDGRDVAPEVDTSIEGNTNRRLNSLRLIPTEATDIDPRTDRVGPSWVDQDGTYYPLGVFRLLDATTVEFSGGDDVETTWGDESAAHHTPNTRSLSWGRGYPIADIIGQIAGVLGITSVDADPTTADIGEPLAYPVGTADWYDIYTAVASAAGMLPPFFALDGSWRWRTAPDWDTALPDHVFSTDLTAPIVEQRIVESSLVRSVTMLASPNTWYAVNTAAGAARIVGSYQLPASAPNSVERTGEVVAEFVEVAGLSNPAAATAAARAAAAGAMDDIGSGSMLTPLDATIELYDSIQADGYLYRSVGSSVTLAPGEPQSIDLRRVYLSTDLEGPYLGGVL
jgi:hypothetical protein